MEQQENSFENPGEKLNKFREEIEKMKAEEQEQGKIALDKVNIEELTLEDLGVWEKIKNESITLEEVTQYKDSLVDEEGHMRNGVSPIRTKFLAFINNKAGGVMAKKQMEKMMKH